MSRLLVRNGRVIDPSQGLDESLDILIEGGLIARIGKDLERNADIPEFDAAGFPRTAVERLSAVSSAWRHDAPGQQGITISRDVGLCPRRTGLYL